MAPYVPLELAEIALPFGLLVAWAWWTARRERLRIARLADLTRPAPGAPEPPQATRWLTRRRLRRALRRSSAARRHRVARA